MSEGKIVHRVKARIGQKSRVGKGEARGMGAEECQYVPK